MAALKSLNLSYFHVSSSPNPPLLLPTKPNLPISTSTPKLSLKPPFHPLHLPISRKFHLCPSSTIQEQISVHEEQDESEETQKDLNKKKLFVLNLPWSFTVADLKNLFGDCGTVADIEIIKREDGKRGFAFVTMSSGEEAQAVIKKFDSHELLGRIVRVEYAKKFKKPSPLRPTSLPETRHKLFVSNLAWKVRTTHLKELFSIEFNPVSVRVVFNPSGRSAGYGFISFASKEEAESTILALNGKELFGRPIIIKFSEESTDKSKTNEKSTSKEEHVES